MSREVLYRENIDSVIKDALIYTKDYYRATRGRHGWHQFLGSDKVGVVATAQALLCFHYFKEDFSEKRRAIATLRQAQFLKKSDITLNSGWAYVTNASTFPTTECTAWALLLLLEERDPAQPCFNSGIGWLLNNHPTQGKTDSGWGSTKSDEARVYPTTLALRVLARSGHTKIDHFIRAKNWLIAARNQEDGGWGEREGSPSTFLHTAHALIALRQCGINSHSEILMKGSDWLLESFDKKRLWHDPVRGGLVEHVDIHAPAGVVPPTQRVTYFHFTIPWVIHALIMCGRVNTSQVFKGINWITENCQKGYWDHPFLVSRKNKVMWAIHDCLMVLKSFQTTFPHWFEIEKLILKNGQIITEPVHRTTKPILKYFRRLVKSRIAWGCFVVILVVLLLVVFQIIPVQQGILGILVPFLIAIVANFLTK